MTDTPRIETAPLTDDDYIQQVMQRLERGEHPNGELLLERDQARRWAERDGTYDAIFAAMNLG